MNPICKACGKEARIMRDESDTLHWHCSEHGFRKVHQLSFVLDEVLDMTEKLRDSVKNLEGKI